MKFIPISSPVPNMNIWTTRLRGYSFVISEDNEYMAFSASWKRIKDDLRPFKIPANEISGGPFKTFNEAKEACNRTLNVLLKGN